jgi:hypothetical protein
VAPIYPKWSVSTRLRCARRIAALAAGVAFIDAMLAIAFIVWSDSMVTNDAPMTSVIAALYGDEGALNENTQRTLHATLGLVRPDTTVLCIGGARPARDFYGAQAMAKWLEDQGLEARRLHVDLQSYDTDSNLEAIVRWQHSNGLAVTVVVDAIHAPRVRARIARNRLDRIAVYAFPFATAVPAPTLWSAWARVHHEAAAILLETSLPPSLYRQLLRTLRSQE